MQFLELVPLVDELYMCCKLGDSLFYSRVLPRVFLPICVQVKKHMYTRLLIQEIENVFWTPDPWSALIKLTQRFASRVNELTHEARDAIIEV